MALQTLRPATRCKLLLIGALGLGLAGCASNERPEADNPLGVKGAGENATTGAPAAVMNAVRDALRSTGDAGVDMPATPERIWRALRRAKPGNE